MELVLYLILGAVAGVLAGLFGIGGGLIIVPVLIFSLSSLGLSADVVTHLAVGTSLATIIFTSVNSVIEHNRKGAVLWPLFRWMSLGIVIGCAIGAVTAAAINGPLLQKIIGVFAIVIAIQMMLDLKPKAERNPPGKLGLVSAGGVIGWASAIFGIGGGSLTVPFLSWCSVPIAKASATSAACGLPIAIASTLTFIWVGWNAPGLPEWSLGYVYLPALFGIAITSMFFARLGARLAHRLSPRLLKRLFALLLGSIGLTFLF